MRPTLPTFRCSCALVIAAISIGTVFLSACVKEQDRGNSGFVSGVVSGNATLDNSDFATLTVGEDGLIRCVVSRIKSPTEFDINFRSVRSVRLPGVEGVDAKSNPELYAEAMSYIRKFAGNGNPIFLRPLQGVDLKDERKVIVAFPLLVAERQPDPDQTLFVDLIQGMLSRGLLKISNYDEFDRPEVARAAYQAEEYAKQNKIGMWGNVRATTAAGK